MTDATNEQQQVTVPAMSKTQVAQAITALVFIAKQFGVAVDPSVADTLADFVADGFVLFGIVSAMYLHWNMKRGLVQKANAIINSQGQKQ